MSHLDDLIAEYCPNGVPYLPLGEVSQLVRGDRIVKSQFLDDGEYSVFQGSTKSSGRYDKANRQSDTVAIVNVALRSLAWSQVDSGVQAAADEQHPDPVVVWIRYSARDAAV